MPLNDTPFTPEWKEVMRQSRNEAGRMGQDYIGPEHFLLGIIRANKGLAPRALSRLQVDLDELKLELERILPVGQYPPGGFYPQSIESKKVVETAKRVAKQLGHNWIGNEHLLLALISEKGTPAERVLSDLQVDLERAKLAVLAAIEELRLDRERQHGEAKPARGQAGRAAEPTIEDVLKDIARAAPAPLVKIAFDDSGFTPEEIAAVLELVSDSYRSVGGMGLKLVEAEVFECEPAGVGEDGD